MRVQSFLRNKHYVCLHEGLKCTGMYLSRICGKDKKKLFLNMIKKSCENIQPCASPHTYTHKWNYLRLTGCNMKITWRWWRQWYVPCGFGFAPEGGKIILDNTSSVNFLFFYFFRRCEHFFFSLCTQLSFSTRIPLGHPKKKMKSEEKTEKKLKIHERCYIL